MYIHRTHITQVISILTSMYKCVLKEPAINIDLPVAFPSLFFTNLPVPPDRLVCLLSCFFVASRPCFGFVETACIVSHS